MVNGLRIHFLKVVLAFAIIFVSASTCFGVNFLSHEYFVATNGSDLNPGTLSRPLLTLNAAIILAGKLSGSGQIIINLRGGTYLFKSGCRISSSSENVTKRILIKNYQMERVVISGGIQIAAQSWTSVKDQVVLSKLKNGAQKHIIETSIADISPYVKNTLHPSGFGHQELPASIELFEDDAPMVLSRWPNFGKLKLSKVYSHGPTNQDTNSDGVGAIFQIDSPTLPHWNIARNGIFISGYFNVGYTDEDLGVLKIEGDTVTLTGKSSYGVYGSINDSFNNTGDKNLLRLRGAYFYNILEELDTPGEYFIDYVSSKIYCWPRNKVLDTSISIALLDEPFIDISHVSNVTIRGISFLENRSDAIRISSSSNISLQNLTFSNIGMLAVNAIKANRLTVYDCAVTNSGSGGMSIDGGDRTNLIPSGNIVAGCEFSQYCRLYHNYAPAIRLNGVGDSVLGCYIHQATAQAILFQGNNHVIMNNRIENVCTGFIDIGAIYTGRDPSSTGTKIENNLFSNIRNSFSGMVAAVYVDDGSGGILIDHNAFFFCGSSDQRGFGAIHINGGCDNRMEGNIFANGIFGISYTTWSDSKWAKFVYQNQALSPLRQKGGPDIRSKWYLDQYPYLKHFSDSIHNATYPRLNYVRNSLCVNLSTLLRAPAGIDVENTYFVKIAQSNDILRMLNTLAGQSPSKEWPGWGSFKYGKIVSH